MQKWSRSKNYIGETYNDYYVLLSRTRDSGLVEVRFRLRQLMLSYPLFLFNFGVATILLISITE